MQYFFSINNQKARVLWKTILGASEVGVLISKYLMKRLNTLPVRGAFRTLLNIKDRAFCQNSYQLSAENIFAKSSILDVCQGFECILRCSSKQLERDFWQVEVVCKNDVQVLFVCLCFTFGLFFSRKTIEKPSRVIIVWSGFFFILCGKRGLEIPWNCTKWLAIWTMGKLNGNFLARNLLWRMISETFFWINSFSSIDPCVTIKKGLSSLFLPLFKLSAISMASEKVMELRNVFWLG